MSQRYAILIGNGSFKNHPRPHNLRCTSNDVNGLSEILKDKSKGAFNEVIELVDKDLQTIRLELYRILKKASKNDLILIYYTGHGKLNRSGKLHLVATDSDYEELEPTSIATSEILDFIKGSNCKTIGLILDCCYSGAISNGLLNKGEPAEVNAQLNQMSGPGVNVMTASTAIQTASERENDTYSLLTKHIIQGLENGDADVAACGRISFSDLFQYAHRNVIADGHQEPTITQIDTRGEFIISFGGRNLRQDRASNLRKTLYKMAADDVIPSDVLNEALIVIDLNHENLDPTQLLYDQLLEKLYSQKLNTSNFILEWGKIFSTRKVSQEISSQSRAPSNPKKVFTYFYRYRRTFIRIQLMLTIVILGALAATQTYRTWDNDKDRGAIAVTNGALGESYSIPIYLNQGWSESDSLWFYNTSFGSNLLPYDFFLALETEDSAASFIAPSVFDKYRFLPQKPTFFNPDGLAVGFVKDTYKNKNFVGFTCAVCHTAQINYKGKAIRVDGGPSMSDYNGYIVAMLNALKSTRSDNAKRERFIKRILAMQNDFTTSEAIMHDLDKSILKLSNHIQLNGTNVDYGFGRLDMLGQLYNKVAQHILPAKKVYELLLISQDDKGRPLLAESQIDLILKNLNENIFGEEQFGAIFERMASSSNGYPGLSRTQIISVKNSIFSEPNAPVSIPAIWDSTRSDFLMWNGRSEGSGLGPIARNTQQSIASFATLDWKTTDEGFTLATLLSGQKGSKSPIGFSSSIDLSNLNLLESHTELLQSPKWPSEILGKIDKVKAARGFKVYARNCSSCHEIITSDSNYRFSKAELLSIDIIQTDPLMALNGIKLEGQSGFFRNSLQLNEEGMPIRLGEVAPLSILTTAATRGLLATPDQDKLFVRRLFDYISALGASFFSEYVDASVRTGSAGSYRARPLNGIWATGPYLHNGSVPSLYELLLPKKNYGLNTLPSRPDTFVTGSREFDVQKVGFVSSGYDGFVFNTILPGNSNTGHMYGTNLDENQRLDLVEFLKTL